MLISIDSTGKYIIGFYNPSGKWILYEEFYVKAEAEKKLNYLNGGSGN